MDRGRNLIINEHKLINNLKRNKMTQEQMTQVVMNRATEMLKERKKERKRASFFFVQPRNTLTKRPEEPEKHLSFPPSAQDTHTNQKTKSNLTPHTASLPPPPRPQTVEKEEPATHRGTTPKEHQKGRSARTAPRTRTREHALR